MYILKNHCCLQLQINQLYSYFYVAKILDSLTDIFIKSTAQNKTAKK